MCLIHGKTNWILFSPLISNMTLRENLTFVSMKVFLFLKCLKLEVLVIGVVVRIKESVYILYCLASDKSQ